MKILIFAFLAMLFGAFNIYADSCLPDGIEFKNQLQLLQFANEYPDCTEIEGDVVINGEQITDLNGLQKITAIGGSLTITYNLGLTSLNGLNNLSSVGGNLRIDHNILITDLTGLDTLSTIGGNLEIIENKGLTGLTGLEDLTLVGGSVFIENNIGLTNLTALSNLQNVMGVLSIRYNDVLESLAGLDSIGKENIEKVFVTNNPVLSECDVNSICDLLYEPGKTVTIEYNAAGCASNDEVKEACGEPGIAEFMVMFRNGLVYPNPAEDFLFINKDLASPVLEIVIRTCSGHVVKSENKHLERIGVSELSAGLYIIEVWTADTLYRSKLLVK